jgi:hypothetical protein
MPLCSICRAEAETHTRSGGSETALECDEECDRCSFNYEQERQYRISKEGSEANQEAQGDAGSSKLNALLGIIGFFIPAEVLSAVLLVFAMENVLDELFQAYVPEAAGASVWIALYVVGICAISLMNYLSATDEELEDLSDDFDDL